MIGYLVNYKLIRIEETKDGLTAVFCCIRSLSYEIVKRLLVLNVIYTLHAHFQCVKNWLYMLLFKKLS
jgi:hypothetical protein